MKSTFQCKKFHIFWISYARDIVSLVKTTLKVQVYHVSKLVQIFVQNCTNLQHVTLHGTYDWKDHQVKFSMNPMVHYLDFSRWSYYQITKSYSRRPTASRTHLEVISWRPFHILRLFISISSLHLSSRVVASINTP